MRNNVFFVIFAISAVILLSGCAVDLPTCGDGKCDAGEEKIGTGVYCPLDCGEDFSMQGNIGITVRDEKGATLEGATVIVRATSDEDGSKLQKSGMTTSSGNRIFNVASGKTYEVIVRADDYELYKHPELITLESGQVIRLEINLQKRFEQ